MIVMGIDLGTVNPAACMLDLRGMRPVVVWRCHGHHPRPKGDTRDKNTSLRQRSKEATDLIKLWLRAATQSNVSVVVIEDPETTAFGKGSRKVTNHANATMLTRQFAIVTDYATELGLNVVTVRPQTVSATLRIKAPACPKGLSDKTKRAHEHIRREAKKNQTAMWCRLCITNAEALQTEDEIDAAALAYVGGRKSR